VSRLEIRELVGLGPQAIPARLDVVLMSEIIIKEVVPLVPLNPISALGGVAHSIAWEDLLTELHLPLRDIPFGEKAFRCVPKEGRCLVENLDELGLHFFFDD